MNKDDDMRAVRKFLVCHCKKSEGFLAKATVFWLPFSSYVPKGGDYANNLYEGLELFCHIKEQSF